MKKTPPDDTVFYVMSEIGQTEYSYTEGKADDHGQRSV